MSILNKVTLHQQIERITTDERSAHKGKFAKKTDTKSAGVENLQKTDDSRMEIGGKHQRAARTQQIICGKKTNGKENARKWKRLGASKQKSCVARRGGLKKPPE
jgi:hypothetical protein